MCRLLPVGKQVLSILFAIALLLALAVPATAYADPGTGALIWQTLAAGFVGFLFYFRRLVAWSRKDKKNDRE